MKNLTPFIQHAIDGIENLINYAPNVNASDLHHELFNTDYFIIGFYQAEQFLIANGGVFAAIGEIQKYEQNNFGEVTTDCSSSEKVVNMLAYIKGEEVLNQCKHLQKRWDKQLDDKDLKKILKELKGLL